MAMDSRVHEVINVNKVVANTSSSAVIICSQCSVGLIAVRGPLLGSVSSATSVAAPLTLAEDGLVVLADHLVVVCAIKAYVLVCAIWERTYCIWGVIPRITNFSGAWWQCRLSGSC